MARKVIIDCDPGIDDAVALCLALFDPRLEIVAVTASAGNVSAEQASRNVQAVIEQLDPPRYPRLGTAAKPDVSHHSSAPNIHGEDGLGNAGFEVSRLQHQHPSDKLMCDEVRAAPDEVAIICLGPLTNVARAMRRDPDFCDQVDRVIMMGGSANAIGDVTSVAEFNMYFDPPAAQAVFRSRINKTLVPLDITKQVPFTLDFVTDLPEEQTRAGGFLRKVVPYLFRSYHQTLGQESIFLHDVVALMAVVQPDLFETTDMLGDVETSGHLTTGMTVFDRRQLTAERPNMEVVTEIQVESVFDCILRGIGQAGRCTST